MTDPNPSFSRRAMLAAAFVGGSAAAAALSGAPAAQAAPGNAKKQFNLTVLGTTDLHGNVFNWDYFKDAEYDDSAHNDIGIAKAATLIKAVRAERGAEPHADHRRRRHHPGHAAGLLLRQDRPDHRGRARTRWPRR